MRHVLSGQIYGYCMHIVYAGKLLLLIATVGKLKSKLFIVVHVCSAQVPNSPDLSVRVKLIKQNCMHTA